MKKILSFLAMAAMATAAWADGTITMPNVFVPLKNR